MRNAIAFANFDGSASGGGHGIVAIADIEFLVVACVVGRVVYWLVLLPLCKMIHSFESKGEVVRLVA